MSAKKRFSVGLDAELNTAVERLARQHKPELSKSYIIEHALLRLLEALEAKQLTLPLALQTSRDADD